MPLFAVRTEKFRSGERKKDGTKGYHLLADFVKNLILYII